MSKSTTFEGRGFYTHDGKLVLQMPDNQPMDDYHYGLHQIIHEQTNLEWREEDEQ